MKYKTDLTLYNSSFDKGDRITLTALLSIFQDVASVHAEDLGVGYEAMLKKGLYWVLSRIKLDVLFDPKPNEEVTVVTWPHVKGIVDFDRDMKILSKGGETLIKATSKWCVIDSTSRKLAPAKDVEYNGSAYEPEVCYEGRFPKIIIPSLEKVEVMRHVVRYSNIDHNGHMNNTNYATLVSDVIENKIVRHIEINFLSECLEGEEIVLYKVRDDKEEYVIGEVDNRRVFVAKTE